MGDNQAKGAILRHLQQYLSDSGAATLSDRQLLERFVVLREEEEFARIVRRHGSLVMGVCQRVLQHAEDAEDVFQATFLVLARKAGSVRWHESVGNWLYGVAYRLARKARAAACRRQACERQVAELPRPASVPEAAWRNLCAALDEEIRHLPEKFRAPILLCYLDGKTRDQATQELGWSLRTLDRRLEQARELLRGRLLRRGVTLPAALLTAGLVQQANAALPATLIQNASQAAVAFAAGKKTIPPLSARAVALAEGGIRAMFLRKFIAALALVIGLVAAGTGASLLLADAKDKKAPPADAGTPVRPKNQELGKTEVERRLIKSVDAGLTWLSHHQAPDGRWSLDNFNKVAKCDCDGIGKSNDMAATGLVVLAFLRSNEIQVSKKIKLGKDKLIDRGLRWLVAHQATDGNLGEGYAHGLNTLVLCEAYAMTGDPWLKGPAQRAVNCSVAWQAPDGGFRYQPRMAGDMSVTSWHVQGLYSARLAGLGVPLATWKTIPTFLDSVDLGNGSFAYQKGNGATAATAACGWLCRACVNQIVSPGKPVPDFAKGVKYLQGFPPTPKLNNGYYFYMATQVINQDPAARRDWNAALVKVLENTQDLGTDARHAHQKGSWPIQGDAWPQLGRLGVTAMNVLALEATVLFSGTLQTTPRKLSSKELAKAWADLLDEGTIRPRLITATLAGAPKKTVPFLDKQLQPVVPADPEQAAKLIAQLGSNKFEERQQATAALRKMGESATPAFQLALEKKPGIEVRRRIERLLADAQDSTPPEMTRQIRAVQVLEEIATPEARKILQKLAKGASGARLTEAARESLGRLDKPGAVKESK